MIKIKFAAIERAAQGATLQDLEEEAQAEERAKQQTKLQAKQEAKIEKQRKTAEAAKKKESGGK
jgi:uncharacterized protein YpiB (UPF0302 family)